jgi:hypothetical protein
MAHGGGPVSFTKAEAAPAGTLATYGHPANNVVARKGADGAWRILDGGLVSFDDQRMLAIIWEPVDQGDSETETLSEAGRFVRARLTQEDSDRHPDDPVRQSTHTPCCLEHRAGRICVLPSGHR